MKAFRFYIAAVALSLWQCDGDDTSLTATCQTDPVSLSLVRKIDPSDCLIADGMIEVAAMGGNGKFQYWVNNRVVNEPAFTDLFPGDYRIIVYDEKNCSDTLLVSLHAAAATNLTWENVRPIFETRCAKSGCHRAPGRHDYSRYDEVFQDRLTIRHKVFTRSMPLDAPMPEEYVRLIVCWIDSGGRRD